jgi:hypothetical protein
MSIWSQIWMEPRPGRFLHGNKTRMSPGPTARRLRGSALILSSPSNHGLTANTARYQVMAVMSPAAKSSSLERRLPKSARNPADTARPNIQKTGYILSKSTGLVPSAALRACNKKPSRTTVLTALPIEPIRKRTLLESMRVSPSVRKRRNTVANRRTDDTAISIRGMLPTHLHPTSNAKTSLRRWPTGPGTHPRQFEGAPIDFSACTVESVRSWIW